MSTNRAHAVGLDMFGGRRTINHLCAPGPDAEQLGLILEAADQAPDHGRCRPWRFLIITSHNAAQFGTRLEQAYLQDCALKGTYPSCAGRQREQYRPLRSPMLIVVLCHIAHGTRIPAREQQHATAAAVQNMLLAATSLGFGSKWSSGPPVTERLLLAAIGCDDGSSLTGFIHLGSIADARPVTRSPRSLADVASLWGRHDECAPEIAGLSDVLLRRRGGV